MSQFTRQPKTCIHVHRNNVNQALLGPGVITPIEFTTKPVDTLNEYNNTAGNYYFQPKHAGNYLFNLQWTIVNNISRPISIQTTLRYFGVATIVENYDWCYDIAPLSTNTMWGKIQAILPLTPNDRIEAAVMCGAANIINGALTRTFLNVIRV
jgi:hypothetical protein